MAIWISTAGLVMVLVAWLHYLQLIPKEGVPDKPVAWGAAMAVGSLAQLGAVALFAFDLRAIVLLVIGWSSAAFFFWLLTQRRTPSGALTVKVGEVMPALQALDEGGAEVMSHEWQGRRVLFKLFRGHW